MHKLMIAAVVALYASIMALGTAQAGATLDAVKGRGELVCGVNTGLEGFGRPDDQGNWTGLDVDTCRAVAAVILSDPTKTKFVPLNAQQRFPALQSGEIDLLVRNTTWTLSRDTSLGFNFAPVTFRRAGHALRDDPAGGRDAGRRPACRLQRQQQPYGTEQRRGGGGTGGGSTPPPATAAVTVGEGDSSDSVEVRLTKGGVVSGRVVESRSGKPIDAAMISQRVSNPTYRPRFTRAGGRIGLAS